MLKRSFLERMLMNEAGSEGGAGGSGDAGDKGDKNSSGGEGDKGSGNSDTDKEKGTGDFDLSKQPKEVQDLVKGLRSENAKFRTGNKSLSDRLGKMESGLKSIFGGDEEDDEAPEEKVKQLSSHAQSLEIKNAMLELAVDNGIGKDQREYFEFLMGKALDSLEEDEELSEEAFEEILSKSRPQGSKGTANSSVDDKGAGKKDPNGQTGIKLEEFLGMSITQKSKLYSDKPDVYNALMGEARNKKLI